VYKKNFAGQFVRQNRHYEWEVCYEAKINQGRFVITRNIDFELREGASPSQSTLAAWKREIEGPLNEKFKLHRRNCNRQSTCDCTGRDGCCMFTIHIVCNWGPGHGKKVSLHKGANDSVWGTDRWWYSHTWWEEIAAVAKTVRAHEFGHLIGFYDEYPEGACDPERRYVDEDSLMGNGSEIFDRHVREFADWFRRKAEPIVGALDIIPRQ
jgi:hypothetical protein